MNFSWATFELFHNNDECYSPWATCTCALAVARTDWNKISVIVEFLWSYVNPLEKCIIRALTPIFGLHKAPVWSCWGGDLEQGVCYPGWFCVGFVFFPLLSPSRVCRPSAEMSQPVSSVSFSFFSPGCGLALGGLRPSNPRWQLSNYCGGRLCPRHWVLNEAVEAIDRRWENSVCPQCELW